MAIAWEFVMISNDIIPSKILAQVGSAFERRIAIRSIFSMDDWEWSNQQKLDDICSIDQKLSEGRIITVELSSSIWKALGLYIERDGDMYRYTLWINTEGFPEIDADRITDKNKRYYDMAFSVLKWLLENYPIPFRCIAIGLESEIQYCPDVMRMISESSGVVSWLVHSGCMINLPNKVQRISLSKNIDVIIW